MVCLSLVALLGAMALSIDLGHLAQIKANMQNATDAAALAAAGNMATAQTAQDAAALCYLANRNQGTVQPSGSGTTSRTYTVVGDTVVATTPYSDAYTTAQGWAASNLIEVRATRTAPLFFAPAVGIPSAVVVSRSLALASTVSGGQWGVGEGCLFALNNGYSLNCNNFTVKGSVYSNSSININLNNITIGVGDTLHAETSVTINGNNVNGDFVLQYGTTYTVNCNTKNIASYTKVPQTPVTPPITYVPANYNSDFSVDYVHTSSWTVSGNTYTFTPGTYYINGDLNISANNVVMTGCTFIVNGNFTCNSNNVTMTPDPNGLKAGGTNYMCVYALGTGTISLNQNNITVHGDLYAPNGAISCNSNNINQGYWVANGISVNCNNFELDGIPGRGGIVTPKIVE
jgi:Flp pilus assembly protein TadG